jgi:hypothetical protein
MRTKLELNSLNALVDDILLEVRNSNISESEHLSRLQIEKWIHTYRALLIKRDLDRGRDVNPEYIQYIGPLHISAISEYPGKVDYVSDEELPSFIDLHFGTGLLTVKDMHGNIIQVGDGAKSKYQRSRRYSCSDYIAYVKNKHLYLEGPGYLEYVEVGGILEDPTDINDCDFATQKYPMPINLVYELKQLIFSNELGIMTQMRSDTVNNSADETLNSNNNPLRNLNRRGRNTTTQQ